MSAEILPLYREDKTLVSSKSEQAALLFAGTSVAKTTADLSDIQHPQDDQHIDPQLEHPSAVTHTEILNVINNLPNKKAVGPDSVANELIKKALPPILDPLHRLFNACIKHAHFPSAWKTATTAILRKFDKPDYSEAGAYRPIALLSCLGKVFESLLSLRLTHWAESTNALAPGHMGGRRQRSVDEMMQE